MAVIWPVTQSYGPVCFNHERGIDSNKTWDKESRKIILRIYTTFCFHIIFPTGLVELTVILYSGWPLVYFANCAQRTLRHFHMLPTALMKLSGTKIIVGYWYNIRECLPDLLGIWKLSAILSLTNKRSVNCNNSWLRLDF
jgi:hypothetical protein